MRPGANSSTARHFGLCSLIVLATCARYYRSRTHLEDVAKPDASGLALLREAAEAMRLSARGYHRVLRVARTLADLDGVDKVGRVHLAAALSYRALADEVRRAA
jgi:predicted ATPase with chaperone activity